MADLQLGLGALADDCALDEAIGVGLRSKNGCVLAQVLDALVPREINLEVMLVGKRIVDSLDERNSGQNVIAHLVHGGLYTGAVVLGEDLKCQVTGSLPCTIEVDLLRLGSVLEQLPLPTSLNLGAENAVPGLGKLCVLVTVETMEGRTSALEDEELLNLGANRHALSFPCNRLNDAGLLAVTVEGVWVRLAVDVHASPSVLDDLDMCGVDVWVCGDEVLANDGGKLLRRIDGVLLREDVGGLLLGIGCDYYRIVCLGVGGFNVSLKQDADSLLDDGVDARLRVLINFVQADVVLAVAGVG